MIEGMIVGLALVLIGLSIQALIYLYKKAKVAAKKKSDQLKPKVQALRTKSSAAISDRVKSKEQKILDIDDKFFKTASYEIHQNTQVEGLWIKSLALAEGNEEKQKALYIRFRAEQLSKAADKETARIKIGLSHTRQKQDRQKQAEQLRLSEKARRSDFWDRVKDGCLVLVFLFLLIILVPTLLRSL